MYHQQCSSIFFLFLFSIKFSRTAIIDDYCNKQEKSQNEFQSNGRGGLFDIFDLFRGPPCLPNLNFGISCHDHFDETPDLSSFVGFQGTILPKTMIDCRPISPSGNGTIDTRFIICDSVNWTQIHLEQIPSRVMYLRINGTRITHLHEQSFNGKMIHMLEIVDNSIDFIHEDAFQGLDGLLFLKISSPTLTADPNSIHHFFHPFRHLKSLTTLVLEDSNLNMLGVDTEIKSEESYLNNLTYLSFRGNMQLRGIEKYLFYPLRNSAVKKLNLQSSRLRYINYDAFRKLPNLEHIDFFDNPDLFMPNFCKFPLALNLGFLNGETFKQIGMSGNSLPLIPKLLLQTIGQNLEKINLSGNVFFDVGSAANSLIYSGFPHLQKLRTLIIQDSQIFYIQDEALTTTLTGLKYLDLRGNKMTTLCKGIRLPTLEYLDISYQCRESCANGDGDFFDQWEADTFANMTQLKILKMSGIYLKNLNKSSFQGLSSLQELHLDHSKLQTVEEFIFQPLKSLKYLDLSFNLNLQSLTSQNFFGLSGLETLSFAYSSQAFQNYPSRLQGLLVNLDSLKFLNLSCALYTNCATNYNYTQALNPDLLTRVLSIEILDLSHNGLTSWNDDRFIVNANLTHLYLQKNNLVFITEGLLATFGRLKYLDFQDNPITCNTIVAHFYQLTLDKPDLLVEGWQGGRGYHCHLTENLTSSITFRDYFESDVWRENEPPEQFFEHWLSGFVFGGVLMVGFTSFICFNVYQKRFYINYFFLLRRRKLMEKRDPNMNYTYDVFVSYSQDEHKWVTEELLPLLENQDPKLKCCIHERDFKVGVTVTENIVECMDRSRKFAMIVSKGFLNSKWCLFETHLAHCRMLDSQENNLVLVLKERVKLKDCDKNLQLLMKTWTYLEWSEKGKKDFWERLRASILREDSSSFKLPHHRKQKLCA